MPARLSRSTLVALSLAFTAGTANAQIGNTVTQGYLDFIGATAGAPTVPNSIAAGPYRAQFGPTSTTVGGTQFDVFCIDWLGVAGDSKVRVFTFSEALTSSSPVAAGLRTKYLDDPEGSAGGLTASKLNAAAWLTTQMTTANKDQWNEMHVALWNIFWDAGVGSPALQPLTFLADGPGAGTDNNAQFWYTQAMGNTGFDASSYRVLASYETCTSNQSAECFNPNRQVFLVNTVPEPSTWTLMAAGLFGLGMAARRRRRNA